MIGVDLNFPVSREEWFSENLPDVQLVDAPEKADVVLFTLFGQEHQRHLRAGSKAKFVLWIPTSRLLAKMNVEEHCFAGLWDP